MGGNSQESVVGSQKDEDNYGTMKACLSAGGDWDAIGDQTKLRKLVSQINSLSGKQDSERENKI